VLVGFSDQIGFSAVPFKSWQFFLTVIFEHYVRPLAAKLHKKKYYNPK